MKRLRSLGFLLLLSLGGCVIRYESPMIGISAAGEGWRSSPEPASPAVAVRHGRLADVTVTVRADDPYTPVRLRVRPRDGATVTVVGKDGPEGVVGAWRLGDRTGHYVDSRVPEPFRFGEALSVPAGADLRVELDPGSVGPAGPLLAGTKIAFTLRIRAGGEEETVPVDLVVVEVRRGRHREPIFD